MKILFTEACLGLRGPTGSRERLISSSKRPLEFVGLKPQLEEGKAFLVSEWCGQTGGLFNPSWL